MSKDAALLEEIKSNYDYARNYWREIYDEGQKDVRYLTDGPWTESEKKERANRVTLSLDELNQYTNQICNEFRQNRRSVKVNPRGDGADDQTSLARASIIREIEYQSRAQQAYVCAGENMVRRSFGFFKLTTGYEPRSANRVIKVVRIPNPEVILLDPDAKEADWSDCEFAFEIEEMLEKEFKRAFGDKVDTRSFSDDDVASSHGWITNGDDGKHIKVASYWKLKRKKNPVWQLEDGSTIVQSDHPEARKVKQDGEDHLAIPDLGIFRIVDEHDDSDNSVVQHITNGIQIIETNPTDWKEIPIIPMFGREEWVTGGGQAKRKFFSAVRHARDAYKAYCYASSVMFERLAMDPKTPYEGYEGQFETATDFENVNKNPTGYVEFKPKTTDTGEVILPMPQRHLAEPQIGQYLSAVEFARRAIQASIGGSPLPTSAQRNNQKSGIALERIENSNDQGNFHFTDNFNIALERAGRMMDDALDVVYDTPREVGARSESGDYSTLKINQRHPVSGQPMGLHTGVGDHGVTISTGPSSQSMRDAADGFLDNLSQNPMVFPKIADLVVKLKNLGPIGDEIAKRLAPPGADGVDPAIQQHIQAAQQTIAQLQKELSDLKTGEAIKKYTVDEQEKTKRVLGLVAIDQQDAEMRLDQMLGTAKAHFQQLHDKYSQAADQQHQMAMQQLAQQHQVEQAQRAQSAQAQQPGAPVAPQQ